MKPSNKVGKLTSLMTLLVGIWAAWKWRLSGDTRRSSEKSPLFRGTVMTTARAAKPLIIRDFPKDGIILRHMADERYRQEAEYMFQSPPELRAATNQYSFVIENTSDKAIMGFV